MGLALLLESARVRDMPPGDLIELVQQDRAVTRVRPPSDGQLELARRLLANDDPLLSGIGGPLLERFLSGEAVPHDTVADRLAELTQGGVRPAMFSTRTRVEATGTGGGIMQTRFEVQPRDTKPAPEFARIGPHLDLIRRDDCFHLLGRTAVQASFDRAAAATMHRALGAMLGAEAR